MGGGLLDHTEPDGAGLADRLRGIHTALVSDALDRLGHRTSFLGHAIRPLARGMAVVGPAFPMRAVAVSEVPEQPYRRLLAAYREISAGEVVVIAGSETRSGMWGELLSIAARARGVTGAVCEGLVRDVAQIEEMGFPVFALGASPVDSAGRQEVVGFGEPIEIGDVPIHRGDLVVGDAMGVVVVPRRLAAAVVRAAEEKRDSESTVREELGAGADVSEVFDRRGVL